MNLLLLQKSFDIANYIPSILSTIAAIASALCAFISVHSLFPSIKINLVIEECCFFIPTEKLRSAKHIDNSIFVIPIKISNQSNSLGTVSEATIKIDDQIYFAERKIETYPFDVDLQIKTAQGGIIHLKDCQLKPPFAVPPFSAEFRVLIFRNLPIYKNDKNVTVFIKIGNKKKFTFNTTCKPLSLENGLPPQANP